jgi:hypothetical protein
LEVRLIHNTSRAYRLCRGGLLDVAAELILHGGEQFIREVCLSTEENHELVLIPIGTGKFRLRLRPIPERMSSEFSRNADFWIPMIDCRLSEVNMLFEVHVGVGLRMMLTESLRADQSANWPQIRLVGPPFGGDP